MRENITFDHKKSPEKSRRTHVHIMRMCFLGAMDEHIAAAGDSTGTVFKFLTVLGNTSIATNQDNHARIKRSTL